MTKKILFHLVWFTIFFVTTVHAEQKPINVFEPGIEVSQITYREPGLMSEKGIMSGLNFSYTRLTDIQWKIDWKVSSGKVKYEGALMDGTPMSTNGINDTMMETRVLRGITKGETAFFQGPYFGYGYRYLHDSLNKSPNGYARQSNYSYMPIGYEHHFGSESDSSWNVGFVIEYDYFLSGQQKSYLSDLSPDIGDMVNDQVKGYGCRASLKLRGSIGPADLILEPFIKYWKIHTSNVATTTGGTLTAMGWEPANNSTEMGIKFSASF